MDQLSCQTKVTQLVDDSLNISWKLHIPYHPQSSGKVERASGLLKDQLTKFSIEAKTSWPDLLPIALTQLRVAPRGPTGLSAFELMYGRPFLLNTGLPTTPPPLASYLPYFSLLRHLLRDHADQFLPQPSSPSDPRITEVLQPGHEVLLKELQPRSLQPRRAGPYTGSSPLPRLPSY